LPAEKSVLSDRLLEVVHLGKPTSENAIQVVLLRVWGTWSYHITKEPGVRLRKSYSFAI